MVQTHTERQTKNSSSGTTVITHGSEISGKLIIDGGIHIDGKVEGEIQCSSYAVIGRKGQMKGTIITNKLYINGVVEAKIFASHVEIYKTGLVKGSIDCRDMIIEPGAKVSVTKSSE